MSHQRAVPGEERAIRSTHCCCMLAVRRYMAARCQCRCHQRRNSLLANRFPPPMVFANAPP